MKKPLFERFIVPLFIFTLLVFGTSLTAKPMPATEDGTRLSFLDVGQGDATLIRSKNNNFILVDGGPDRKVIEELGREMPVMKRDIKAIILTHPHADHLAGLNYVLDTYRVEKVYLTGVMHTAPDYTEFLERLKKKEIQVEKMYYPKEIVIDDIAIKAFWPKEDLAGMNIKDINASSIAATVTYGQNNVLLLGDLPDEQQEEIAPELARAVIMKVAHHGAADGVSKKLLEVVQPEFAIISLGENSYGHPTQKAINLLSAQKIRRTDLVGTIRFFLTETTVNPL